ncbi:MAG: ABC transporter permease subunit [Pseudomonadota bacterium]
MIARIRALAAADAAAFYAAPSSYLLLALFLLATGYGFLSSPSTMLETSLRGVFVWIAFILMFLCPALAARMVTREIEDGPIELTLTAPISDGEFILAKFFAGAAVLALFIAASLVFVLILLGFGDPELGPLASGYLGVITLSLVFLAVSLTGAAAASNQALGFLLGVLLCVSIWVAGHGFAEIRWLPDQLQTALSLPRQFDMFTRGLLDSRAVVLPLTLAALMLFAASLIIELRRRN